MEKKKYFYFKKKITEEERLKLWSLGEKGFLFETLKQEYILTKTYLAMLLVKQILITKEFQE